jgi:hypothetical protein
MFEGPLPKISQTPLASLQRLVRALPHLISVSGSDSSPNIEFEQWLKATLRGRVALAEGAGVVPPKPPPTG